MKYSFKNCELNEFVQSMGIFSIGLLKYLYSRIRHDSVLDNGAKKAKAAIAQWPVPPNLVAIARIVPRPAPHQIIEGRSGSHGWQVRHSQSVS